MVGAGFCVVGLVLTALGFAAKRRYDAMGSWPVCEATVTGGEVNEEAEGFMPAVLFEFNANGETVSGGVANWEEPSAEDAQGILEQHPIGTTLKVRYDPENPEDHITEIEDHVQGPGFMITGAVFLVVGAVLLCV